MPWGKPGTFDVLEQTLPLGQNRVLHSSPRVSSSRNFAPATAQTTCAASGLSVPKEGSARPVPGARRIRKRQKWQDACDNGLSRMPLRVKPRDVSHDPSDGNS
ncbi:unnamed protein product [Laminaria digitata]